MNIYPLLVILLFNFTYQLSTANVGLKTIVKSKKHRKELNKPKTTNVLPAIPTTSEIKEYNDLRPFLSPLNYKKGIKKNLTVNKLVVKLNSSTTTKNGVPTIINYLINITNVNIMINKTKKIYVDTVKFQCSYYSCDVGPSLRIYNDSKIQLDSYYLYIMVFVDSFRISLGRITYKKLYFPLFYCPSKYWIKFSNETYFVPDESLKEIENLNKDKKKNYLVPIFWQKDYSEFFMCGVLKQTNLPDISVGYDVVTIPNKAKLRAYNNITSKKCKDKGYNKTFGYTDVLYNYNSTRSIRKINDTNFNVYFGELLYFYKYHDEIQKFLPELKVIRPGCVLIAPKTFPGNETLIIPSISNLNGTKVSKKNNIIYYTVKSKDYGKIIYGKCKVSEKNFTNISYTDYYSNAMELKMAQQVNDSAKGILYVNEVKFLKTTLDNFGLYVCKIGRTSNSFKNVIIKTKSLYVLPENEYLFHLQTIDIKEKNLEQSLCRKSFGNFSLLKKFQIRFDDKNKENIEINLSRFKSVDEALFKYSTQRFSTTINVTCIYKTIANTNFKTNQKYAYFIHPRTMTRDYFIRDFNLKEKMCITISVVVCIVSIISFIGIIYVYRKIKSRSAYNERILRRDKPTTVTVYERTYDYLDDLKKSESDKSITNIASITSRGYKTTY
uniref:Ig-like domain-containing protein n=1 Tax=Parastrongyloides trichosuri TaxID=131310 RepID=A0A0N4ZQH2_PARTI